MARNLEQELEQYNVQVEKNYQWNCWMSIADGSLYSLGMGFVSLYTILSLFVLNLTDSKILISLVTTISMLGLYLPQIFIANYVERAKSKKLFTAIFGLGQRLPWLFLAIFVYMSDTASPGVLLVGFFLFFGIYSTSSGLTVPPWFDLTMKIIPMDRRGRYFGNRNFFCGIAELIGAAIAGWILKAFLFPRNFSVLFFLTFIATSISFLLLIQLRESDFPLVKKRVSMKEYLGSLPQILAQFKNFRYFITALIFIQFYVMGNALYSASAIERLGLDRAQAGIQVGIFTGLMLGFQTVSFPIWGHLSDRKGHLQIILLASGLNILAAMAAMIGSHLYLYYLVFILAGIAQGATRISLMAIIPEFCSAEDRPTFLGLTNSISGVSITIASLLGGIIADLFNYRMTFLTTAVLLLIGTIILLKKVEDPRKSIESRGLLK